MKRVFKTVMTLSAIVLTLVNLVLMVFHNSVYTLSDLPTGEKYATTADDGLNKPYVVTLYIVNAGGRLGKALRAEATELETGKTYNVYWETDITATPLVSWVSDYQLIINEHTIELTPDGVHYDSRTANLDPAVVNNGATQPNI